MNRNTLLSICAPLREALLRNRYDTDTLLDTLGPDIHAALGRNEPVPVRRASASCGELGTLIRLFLLGDDCPIAEVAAALRPLSVEAAVDAGLLASDAGVVRAALDLRPIDTGSGNRWVLSDLDGSMRPRETAVDHVIGVGHASLSLLQATPGAPVGSLLDVGTGCGIQALHGTSYAQSVTATDLNVRAVDLAAVTMALNEEEVELLTGSWFEPVEGRTFDQVVANPPFVVSRATVGHTYRDSGLDLDGASRLMISRSPDYLAPGGTAALLASWVHVAGEDWRNRVASWLPAHGIDAWVVQRDVADPALYVGTWMRDGGLDTKDPSAAATAEQWLDHLESADVEESDSGSSTCAGPTRPVTSWPRISRTVSTIRWGRRRSPTSTGWRGCARTTCSRPASTCRRAQRSSGSSSPVRRGGLRWSHDCIAGTVPHGSTRSTTWSPPRRGNAERRSRSGRTDRSPGCRARHGCHRPRRVGDTARALSRAARFGAAGVAAGVPCGSPYTCSQQLLRTERTKSQVRALLPKSVRELSVPVGALFPMRHHR